MKILTIGTIILFAGIHFSQAQTDTTQSQASVMDLDFIIGEWEGTGWMMTRNGRSESIVKEKAEYKLDKSIIVVEGIGTKTDSLTQETKVIHDAFGVIFFDAKTHTLSINAYKEGESTLAEIEVLRKKVIRWNLLIPQGGEVRFTVDFSKENTWIEVGEFSMDGNNWRKFLGTELTRKEN